MTRNCPFCPVLFLALLGLALVPSLAVESFAALVGNLFCPPAWAQAERAYSIPGNRVLSIDTARDEHSLVIRTQNSTVAGRPVFKYFSGPDGETILTADFVGLAWNSPAKIIRLISSEKPFRSVDLPGIKEVRVGQFAESPAVMRISFVAHDARVLKSVAIAAGPGIIKVSWGANSAAPVQVPSAVSTALSSSTSNSTSSAIPLAPPLGRARPSAASARASASYSAGAGGAAEAPTNFPVSSPANGAIPPTVSAGRLPRQADFDRPVATAAGEVGAAQPTLATKANSPAEELNQGQSTGTARSVELGEPPVISLVPCDSLGSGASLEIFRLELPAGHELRCRTFRLHNPERYVIDIPNCPALANASVPDLTASALVTSLRVGVPDQTDGTGRLVLQLTDNQVNVADRFTPGSNYLTVTLGKGLMLGNEGGQSHERYGDKVSEKFSSGDIAPGPIFVPRAPSETVVVLDAGHGGTDPGAMREGIQEKDITLGIIEKLKKILEAKGARIVLTRHDDTFVSLEDRTKITNQVGPNLFLSVHINSLESTSNICGIETYFQTELSRPLAERVHASLVAGLSAPDRNIRRARFYVINHTPVPAILAEVGYITNKAERDRLISSDYQEKVASALARGVMLYLQDTGAASGQLANSAKGVSGQSPQ